MAWSGGADVEAIAETLRAKGVTLETYPDLGMDIDRGVHKRDSSAGIWFKDPDGNILHVYSMQLGRQRGLRNRTAQLNGVRFTSYV